MRRATAAAVLALLLVLPGVAEARGGGGSAGFGGGRGFGGGFGGRGFGGGRFFFFGGGFGHGGGRILLGLVIAIVVVVALVALLVLAHQARAAARHRARVAQVERAALEAAEQDAAFDSSLIHARARELFVGIQQAWSAGDRRALAALCGPDLMVEWGRRLDDLARRGWRNEVSVLGDVRVDLVGLVNREEDRDDRVVVRIRTRIQDVVRDAYGRVLLRNDSPQPISTISEYWTLGKRDGNWILLSIEQQAEGLHEEQEEIVATPWGDTSRLQAQSLVEGAMATALPAGAAVADIAPPVLDPDARAAALDLSLVDGRFAPDVLVAEVGRAVAAWTEAVDGSDDALLELAIPSAARALLHPGDTSGTTRLVVRGLDVRAVRIVSLAPRTDPPTLTVELEVRGRRYVEDRDTTAVLAGSQSAASQWQERWTLALQGPPEHPWQIVDAHAG